MKRRVVDVSELPPIAFTVRDPLWWAVMMLVAIEGTMLVLLALAYGFVAERTDPFPPVVLGHGLAWIMTLELGLWMLSAWPQRRASHHAIAGSVVGMRRSLIAATSLAIAGVLVRLWLFDWLPFRWDDHAYGSVVWGLLGVQFLHAVTAVCEDLLYIVLLFTGPVEDKHRVDVEVSAPLVYFVVCGEALIWAVVFLPVLLGAHP